jgi:hypothetical protein
MFHRVPVSVTPCTQEGISGIRSGETVPIQYPYLLGCATLEGA